MDKPICNVCEERIEEQTCTCDGCGEWVCVGCRVEAGFYCDLCYKSKTRTIVGDLRNNIGEGIAVDTISGDCCGTLTGVYDDYITIKEKFSRITRVPFSMITKYYFSIFFKC